MILKQENYICQYRVYSQLEENLLRVYTENALEFLLLVLINFSHSAISHILAMLLIINR